MEDKSVTFEEAFHQLESIVQRLEAGDMPLDDSLAQFERGVLLARYCENRLEQAELKVNELVAGEGGEVTIRPSELVHPSTNDCPVQAASGRPV